MKSFSSKVLLFGEYTVIRGGAALAIPYDAFKGHWGPGAPSFDWNPLLRFIAGNPELGLDLERLRNDLEQGYGFHSTIPQGKGLGSSGALVAAIMHSYGPPSDPSLDVMQKRLAGLEACYHGQSSGVDPLVSWVGKPLLLQGTQGPVLGAMPVEAWKGLERWFLWDSNIARISAPLVALYKKKTEDPEYQATMEHLTALVSEAIDCYEHLDEALMGHTMRALSELELSAFREMIPAAVREVWEAGLRSNEFALKLCGAGGGGFFLGYRLKIMPTGALKF
ncbi:MAG: mevalonate kinase [Bacteriovoracia bacterium]